MTLCRMVAALAVLSLLSLTSGCGSDSGGGGGKALTFDEQVRRAKEIASPGERAQELVRIGEEQVKAGDTFNARNTLRDAHDAAKDVDDVQERASLFARCARVQFDAGKRSDGRKSMEEAIKAAKELEKPEAKATQLANIAVLQSKANENADASKTIAQAEGLIPEIENADGKKTCQLAIARSYHEMKKSGEAERLVQAALETAKAMEDAAKRVQAVADVAEIQKLIGQDDAAAETFQHAVSMVEEISRDDDNDTFYARSYALAEIGEKMYLSGFKKESKKALNEAEKAAGKVKDGSLKKDVDRRIGNIRQDIYENKL